MISFEEKTHTYTNTKTNEKYISVTTLIDQYVPEYDSDYWSLYKAIKDVLSNYNQFSIYKISSGGWKKVVANWKRNPLLKYKNEVEDKQANYLLQWTIKRDLACEVGTAEHKKREDEVNAKDYCRYENEDYETPALHSQKDILQMQDFTSNRIYTELLVYNDKYKVAGQVDWVRKKGKRVWIKDYKTGEEITKEAFMNEKMKTPLNDLPNAKWYIYQLQLSTYGWLLEQCGYEVMELELLHTRENKSYDVPYIKGHVERMMEDYITF